MLEFIVSFWYIFVIITVVLLLGLFGYIIDKKKYEEYKDEIMNQGLIQESMTMQPDVNEVAEVIPAQQENK